MYRHCLAALLLVGPIAAQNCKYVPGNTPSAGNCNVIPFGTTKTSSTWANQKYQTILLTSQLGNVPGRICELAFSPCGTGLRSFDTIEIKMNHTTLTGFTGNTNFANNLGTGATTVLASRNYAWNNTANTWNRIGLQKEFLYIPARGNVIVEITVTGCDFQGSGTGFHRSNTNEYPDRLYAFSWSGTPPATGSTDRAGLKIEACFDIADQNLFGLSCAGSTGTPQLTLSGSAKGGQTSIINLTGGPSAPPIAILNLGFNSAAPFPVTLPGTNCQLYASLDLTFGIPTSGGAATVNLPLPQVVCVKVYAQWFLLDSQANSLGVTSTNYGRILIGSGP